ncbi:MAG: recombination mediator RecR [Flavobacteriales bacterium]|nr:recombination mediator RecR [Flavobacteriales bacterium]MCX7768106.1 recombination mediator RecR [Flavobacteriales bacterium]MDW8409602.1 recombination mediator RecR [Flavobacteriales bacterium]
MTQLSSQTLQRTVELLSSWPGVGRRTALRYVLYLMRQPPEYLKSLAEALGRLPEEVQTCQLCGNYADAPLCTLCQNAKRSQQKIICVVEDIPALLAIENTGSFQGLYHVLGGCIAPGEGIGPEQLRVRELLDRVKQEGIQEVILAFSPTPEGDTTAFYLHKRLQEFPLRISTLARGIGFGNELEYTDDLTLARSILQRIPYSPMQG